MKIAKTIKRIISGEKLTVHKKEHEVSARYKTGSSQDMIPIQGIEDGVIHTTDGRYVSIIEIAAVNYDKMNSKGKAKAIEAFGMLFGSRRMKWQFKIMNNPSNASDLVKNIKKAKRYGSNEAVTEAIDKYIDYANDAGKRGAANTKYFIIYEYEGDEKEPARIAKEMYLAKLSIKNVLKKFGSYIITEEQYDVEQLEVLYMFFNRQSYLKESVGERTRRLKLDIERFNQVTNKDKQITIADMVAPKGISFTNKNYVYMDGIYYGFLGLKTKCYPTNVFGAWLNSFAYGNMIDIDVHVKRLPKEMVRTALSIYNNYSEKQASSAAENNNRKKLKKFSRKLENNVYIEQAINGRNQDLYDYSIIITVRGHSPRELGDYMRIIESDMKTSNDIEFDTCFDCAEEYFVMTMPLLFITKPFKRIKHNALTEDLKTIFPMTAYNLYDPRGWIAGINKENNSLCAINLFNTDLGYRNANLAIFGAPGSGKTFCLKLMSTRLYYNGVDVYFIIPKKGYDFITCCNMTGGTYVPMFPLSKTCVNFMEIRPEKSIDESLVDESTVVDRQTSLLGKKVTSICTWLSLVSRGTHFDVRLHNIINECLIHIYSRYGITDDNDSIWEDEDHTRLKKMPILQDLYEELLKQEELANICECMKPFITGSFRNFNGQTNINLSSDFICFDCDEDVIGETLHPAILYIAQDFCYDRVKDPNSGKSIIVMDETWKMMQTEDSAKQVQNMVKLVRGYLSSTCVATQEIEDYMSSAAGKSIINDSATKLCLGMEPEGAKLVAQILNLSNQDVENIMSYDVGTGMLVSRGQKTEIMIQPSQYEFKRLTDKTRSAMNS